MVRELLRALAAVAVTGCFATVGPEGRGSEAAFSPGLPAVLPPLVVAGPGVSVVRDYPGEVFHSGGYYWVRKDGEWYRSHHHQNGWSRVEARHVPGAIARSPPGRYRHYRGDPSHHAGPGHAGNPR